VEIEFISFLCDIFSFNRVAYEDFFVWNAVSCSLQTTTDYSKKPITSLLIYVYVQLCGKTKMLHLSRFSEGDCFSPNSREKYT